MKTKLLSTVAVILYCAVPTLHAQEQGAVDHAKMDHSKMDHSKMDHSKMDHSKMDHSKMDHSKMDHSKMDHSATELRTPIPVVTEEDRLAAFPDIHEHHVHGTGIYRYFLVDRLEADDNNAYAMEATGWIGGDIRKLQVDIDVHGSRSDGMEAGGVDLMYSQGIRTWWDVLAGVRQEFPDGASRTWLAVGVQGLAPYKFEVSAKGYFSGGGRAKLNLEGEYETLITNRLILQWRGEVSAHNRKEPEVLLGSGLTTASVGARLRYEIRREFAPYIGVVYERALGETRDIRASAGEKPENASVVAGVRFWF